MLHILYDDKKKVQVFNINMLTYRDLILEIAVMLINSDRSIEEISRNLAKDGIEATYLVPTNTAMTKSIIDAHLGVRDYFEMNNFHEYSLQMKGPSHKVIKKGVFINQNGFTDVKISLYRPETKNGDPRIWIYGLRCLNISPNNLLALIIHEDILFIFNASSRLMISDEGVRNNNLECVLESIKKKNNSISNELFEKINNIAKRGWIESRRLGSTGIGYTLEDLLDIKANNSKQPDYKGIEIKSGRVTLNGNKKSRTTIFSKTPNWEISSLKNGLELLDSYGYIRNGVKRLCCTLSNEPNNLGHYLEVVDEVDELHANNFNTFKKNVLVWKLKDLRDALLNKHKETFWIDAISKKGDNGEEYFKFIKITHTKKPLPANFIELLRDGRIQLDYLIKEKLNKKNSRYAKDHGYLFKIWSKDLDLLFPEKKEYYFK